MPAGQTWVGFAIFLGIVFISIFYLMAITTQRLTVAVSSMASKMSLVLPVLFSLLILGKGADSFDGLNYTGLSLAFLAIFMTGYTGKAAGEQQTSSGMQVWLLPLAVFLGSGLIDIVINYSNTHYVTEAIKPLFPVVSFGTAAVVGTILLLSKKIALKRRNIIAGIVLGVPNYFSIFFIFEALSAYDNNGAMVYPVLNIGIITLSAVMGVLLFRERLSLINWLGLVVAALAIVLISWQGLFAG